MERLSALLEPATSPRERLDAAALTRFYPSRLHLPPGARRRLVYVLPDH